MRSCSTKADLRNGDIMELLANKIRPTKLSEVIGQTHLIGENKIITNLI